MVKLEDLKIKFPYLISNLPLPIPFSRQGDVWFRNQRLSNLGFHILMLSNQNWGRRRKSKGNGGSCDIVLGERGRKEDGLCLVCHEKLLKIECSSLHLEFQLREARYGEQWLELRLNRMEYEIKLINFVFCIFLLFDFYFYEYIYVEKKQIIEFQRN